MISFPILTMLIVVPAVGALLVASLSNHRPEWVKLTALLTSASVDLGAGKDSLT